MWAPKNITTPQTTILESSFIIGENIWQERRGSRVYICSKTLLLPPDWLCCPSRGSPLRNSSLPSKPLLSWPSISSPTDHRAHHLSPSPPLPLNTTPLGIWAASHHSNSRAQIPQFSLLQSSPEARQRRPWTPAEPPGRWRRGRPGARRVAPGRSRCRGPWRPGSSSP